MPARVGALRPASPRDQPRVRTYRHQLAARPRRGTDVRLDAVVAGAVDDRRRVQAGGGDAALADGVDPRKRTAEGPARARGVEAARRDIGAAGAHGAGGRLDAKAIAPADERAGLAALRLRAVAERGGQSGSGAACSAQRATPEAATTHVRAPQASRLRDRWPLSSLSAWLRQFSARFSAHWPPMTRHSSAFPQAARAKQITKRRTPLLIADFARRNQAGLRP